jgi:hypothetical protein
MKNEEETLFDIRPVDCETSFEAIAALIPWDLAYNYRLTGRVRLMGTRPVIRSMIANYLDCPYNEIPSYFRRALSEVIVDAMRDPQCGAFVIRHVADDMVLHSRKKARVLENKNNEK